jgi:hypothetical protein
MHLSVAFKLAAISLSLLILVADSASRSSSCCGGGASERQQAHIQDDHQDER